MSVGIRGKLSIGLGAFLLLFVGAGIVGWSNTIFFSTSFNTLFENHLLPESRLSATQQGLYELRLITSVYVAADRKTRATLRADDAKRRQQVDDNMTFYGRGNLSPAQREALATWKAEYATYLDARETGLLQADKGSNFDASDTFNQRADPLFGRVIAALDALGSLEAAEAGTLNAVVSDAADLSRKLLAGALALVTILGVGVALVVSRSEGFERQLRQLAFRDSLTGLPNRALFGERLAQALARGNRHERPVSVLFLDLDGFKAVNDSLGHQVGDALLCEVAVRLRSCLRTEDTAARLGGDEFTILLGDHATEAIAQQVADRITQALEVPMQLHGRPVVIGASIGIGMSVPGEDSPESLLRRADLAMYQAKERAKAPRRLESALSARGPHERFAPDGENSGHVDDVGERERDPVTMDLIAELGRAIDEGQLVLHYQPQVDLTTERVVGVEALVRWHHPTRGLVPPDGFIPVAEQHGLIQRLSRWVLENAIQQAIVWLEEGLDLPVAVNLSAYDVQDATLPETVGRLLLQYALPADRLRVEVTESALMADRERAAEVLGRFRALGVRVAVDDFGTGYSSLAYLKQLPVDELKIDKAFVEHLASNAQDCAIVRAIVGLAHELGMGVVAEGVEDRATWQALRRAGCDTAQGYLMSRALPAADVPAWLALSESHLHQSRRAA